MTDEADETREKTPTPPDSPSESPPRLSEYVPEGRILDSEVILDRFLRWVEATNLSAYEAQEEALLELATGRHVILSTPTGSGKSLVAQGLHFHAMCSGERSFYTAPIKALVSEKFFDLCNEFGAENVGMLTGDASINRDAPILCCTAEILGNMALSEGESLDAPYVVMDEFHYFGDRDRGMAWQVPLLSLRHTQYLLMSATLGDTRTIEELIEGRTGVSVARVHSSVRPVPLDFAYVETPIHETIEKLLAGGKAPIYIVHFTQRDAADQAQALTSANIATREARRAISQELIGFRFDSPYGKDVERFVRHGIGIHHAGLLPKYRRLIERLAQQGLLEVICGTDTLGVGVNIPIRTVLFTKLCKFDGEKVTIVSVRDFLQIAGRAGRKGFDDQGSVVCQAPEHVIDNKRIEAKGRGLAPGKKKKLVKKKAPTKGYVAWNEETLERLSSSPPEPLVSRFRIDTGLIVSCLRSGEAHHEAGSGYRRIADLIDRSLEEPKRRKELKREAAVLFRALQGSGILQIEKLGEGAGSTVRVSGDLQRDFSLYQTISLYLVEAAESLDPGSPDLAADLLTLVEAILENPRALLIAQERRIKSELMAELKASGVPFEERIEKLDQVTWPKPNADFIYATFNLFAEKHPWVGEESIRPKAIAREIFESFSAFNDFVARSQMARMEGVLLRYLSQVHNTLVRSIPEAVKSEAVHDMIAYFHTMLARVDSTLLEEWEALSGASPSAVSTPDTRSDAPSLDLRAFRARIRSELHHLVRSLAGRRYDEAAKCVHDDRDDPWDAERIEAAFVPFYEDYEAILFDPPSRQAHFTRMEEREHHVWDVSQVLCDDQGDHFWHIEAEVRIDALPLPDGPLLRLRRIET